MSSRKEKGLARGKSQMQAWSRPEGKAFDLPPQLDPRSFSRKSSHTIEGYKDRQKITEWCNYHSVFYNGMLNVAIEPTRMIDVEILREMGIDSSVNQLIRDMGLGTMPYADYDLYPDLVRQFLATFEVHDSSKNPSTMGGRFSFFCNGERYYLYVKNIGHIYKWETISWDRKYNERTLQKMEDFWEMIGYGDFTSDTLKIARIANPTLRIVAKTLASTFFCRQEPDRITKSALVLLFTGLSSELRDLLTFGTKPRLDTIDLSGMFADILADRKYRGLGHSSNARIDSIGSLITPILKFAGVDLSHATVVTHRVLMDRAYLERSRIYRHGIYHWTTRTGIPRYCKLPKPEWTGTFTLDQIGFTVPGPEQCTSDGRVLPEFDTNRDLIPVIAGNAHERFCRHGNSIPDSVPLTTDLPDEFYDSIPPLPAGASLDDWRGHYDMVQGQQTTILREIVGALTHVNWAPTAPCCSAPPGDTDQQQE